MKTIALCLTLFSYSIFASEQAQIRNLENRVSALEQRKSAGGVILPSSGANLDDDVGISLDAELLIWKAHQTGMNFASGKSNDTPVAPFLKPNFRFDPGVRVNLGFRPSHDDWQIDATWTHFNTKAKKSYDSSLKPVVPFFLLSDDTLAASSSLSAIWRANLNTIDLDLSRASFLSKWTSIKPYFGIRNIWLYQKYLVAAATENGIVEAHLKSDLWSIGPKAGFELKFDMGQGFYFFSNNSAALTWGFFKNQQKSEIATTEDNRPIDIHTSTFNFDMMLGLGWDKRFDDNHYRISVRAAWEHHLLMDTNFFVSDANKSTFKAIDTPSGNFTTEGFTLGFRFDF